MTRKQGEKVGAKIAALLKLTFYIATTAAALKYLVAM